MRQDRLRAPGGHEYTYTVVEHPGAVWVVPVTRDGEVVLIRNYRHPVSDWCWEVPAGGLSEGLSREEVARRELLEEAGGTGESLHYVGRFYTSNGICSEVAHVYLATGVTLGEAQREVTEQMEVCVVPAIEAVRMARSGEISDGPSALALLWCEALLAEFAHHSDPTGV